MDADFAKALKVAMAVDFEGGRRRQGTGFRPSDAQCLADLADVPLDADTVAAGEWQDDESERDPLLEDDVPIGYDPQRWDSERTPF